MLLLNESEQTCISNSRENGYSFMNSFAVFSVVSQY